MNLNIFQRGFNYSQDGPGNRLVYHLSDCNLHCPWCSNPEGLTLAGGTSYSLEALLDEVRRSSMLFFDGGGVTLTGGEVTMQFEPLKQFLQLLKQEGIHTCIETNGLHPRLPDLFPYLDLLIMDIKHYDPEIHRAVTGLPNTVTIDNLRAALACKQPTALRIPLIGGFNASAEDAEGFAKLFCALEISGKASLELLTYHEYGKDKYKALGLPYQMGARAKITPQQLKIFSGILTDAGISLIHT